DTGTKVISPGPGADYVIVVDATGWRLEATAQALFRHSASTGRLPKPQRVEASERAAGLDELARRLNLESESCALLLAWLVATYVDIPVPIAVCRGRQGSGKSTAAERAVGLVDTCTPQLRAPPRGNLDDFAMSAFANHVSVLDNVSAISAATSDAYCWLV